MVKFSFLFLLTFSLLLCIGVKLGISVWPSISLASGVKEDMEKTEKSESLDEKKENEGKVGIHDISENYSCIPDFLYSNQLRALNKQTDLPVSYYKVPKQPPKQVFFTT